MWDIVRSMGLVLVRGRLLVRLGGGSCRLFLCGIGVGLGKLGSCVWPVVVGCWFSVRSISVVGFMFRMFLACVGMLVLEGGDGGIG